MNGGELNLAWADALLAGLVAAGATHAVIAPGARSSALALAALRRPELRCEILSDERVAGYFALGIARATRRPAIVICTSGTAAANLLPAAMEANLAAVPLLLLTADRPPEAQDWGGNQTAAQTQLYGSQARAFHAVAVPDASLLPAAGSGYLRTLATRLVEECLFPLPGPVHANLPFREPLLPAAAPPGAPPLAPLVEILRPDDTPAATDVAALAQRLSGRRGVILCGEGAFPPAFAAALTQLAAMLNVPILAEALSNLRFGSHDRSRICVRQEAFLRTAAAREKMRPAWVLRFGAFPVARSLEHWLAGLDAAEHILVAPPGSWPDPLWRSDRLLRCAPLALVRSLTAQGLAAANVAWLDSFQASEARCAAAADAACAPAQPFEGSVAATLMARLPDGAQCFVGNSLAIRAMDAFSGTGAQAVALHGNRGASGIDGNLATAAGIAAATNAPTVALIGDQAALHDAGGMAALKGRNIVVVVANNNGGGIFDHLPLAAVDAASLERGWVAPSGVSLAGLAAAHGLGHIRPASIDDFAAALDRAWARGGPWLVEVPLDRLDSLARFRAYRAATGI